MNSRIPKPAGHKVLSRRYLLPMARKQIDDYGFSSQAGVKGARLINQDGSFNVVRRGLPFFESFSVYHTLINISWLAFYGAVLCVFLIVNSLFAAVYLLLGVSHLHGLPGITMMQHFTEAFFFSSQTITAGFGHVYPEGFDTSVAVTLESIVGLLGFAIVAGLHFARFARPQAKILFSRQALVAPYQEGHALMFRMANARNHPLIEIEAQIGLAWVRNHSDKSVRQFHNLQLERNHIDFFPLTWTVVHPIDEQSPLHGVTAEELKDWDAEFFIVVKAFDDSFNQTVRARFSYKPSEIVWGAKFTPAFNRSEDGTTYVDLHRLNDHELVELPSTRLTVRETTGG